MIRRDRLAPLVLLVLPLLASDCPENNSPIVPTVLGTVQGTVTVDGTGQAGVTVTLSTGATAVTGAVGQYVIPDVPEGVHTATISGFPEDVTFPATSKAFAIASQGQTLPIDFAGSIIRTSAVTGTVTLDGAPLAGVEVNVHSDGSGRSGQTDGMGVYTITGLRAGLQTVSITPPPGVLCERTFATVPLQFDTTSQVDFACTTNNAPPEMDDLIGIYMSSPIRTVTSGGCPAPIGNSSNVQVINPDSVGGGNMLQVDHLDPDVSLKGPYTAATGGYSATGMTTLANNFTIQSDLQGTFTEEQGKRVFRGRLVRIHRDPDGVEVCREEYDVEFEA